MKQNFLLITLVLGIILIINIYMLYIIKFDNTGIASIVKKSQGDNLPKDFYYIKENYLISFRNNEIALNNSRVYFGNDTTSTFHIFNKLHGKYLVFRFSGDACNACIDFVIERIKRVFKDYSINERIILIGSNINPRVKDGYYQKKILSFYETDFGLELEKFGIPFLFIIDKEQISKMIFIPDKSFPEITDEYLNNI